MSEENNNSSAADDKAASGAGADKADSARDGDKSNEHMIPKARFDEEAGKRKALEKELGDFADDLIKELPDAVKELLPDGLNVMARLKWWAKAKGSAVTKAEVPETDKGKPRTTPKDRDLSTLPPVARMAAAYKKAS